MATFNVALKVSVAMANGAAKRKPRRAFTGVYRKRVKALLDAIRSMGKLDAKETSKAASLGIPAITFVNLGNLNIASQLAAVELRCTDALAARVGGGAVVPPP